MIKKRNCFRIKKTFTTPGILGTCPFCYDAFTNESVCNSCGCVSTSESESKKLHQNQKKTIYEGKGHQSILEPLATFLGERY